MVFPKTLYYHRILLCGASGVAPDLVAATNDESMEDRTHHRNPCSQFDLVPNHYKLSTSVYIPTEFVTYPCLKDLKMKHITLILISLMSLTGCTGFTKRDGLEVEWYDNGGLDSVSIC